MSETIMNVDFFQVLETARFRGSKGAKSLQKEILIGLISVDCNSKGILGIRHERATCKW